MRPFQIGVLVAFGVIALLGLILFSTYKGSNTKEENLLGEGITIWGTLPRAGFNAAILQLVENGDKRFNDVRYVEKDARTFDAELLNALAESASPDLVVVSQADLVKWRSKLYPISYETLPQRTFKDRYVEGAEIFMRNEGVFGIPFAVNPLVMYWNRDLFSTAGFTQLPTTYESLLREYVPRLNKVDQSYRIAQSALALGEQANVAHAKEILAMLMIQSGATIVDETGGNYQVSMHNTRSAGLNPANTALTFFTQFSNPQSSYYSWSRALPSDTQQFASSLLALYFGFGSELPDISARNPNLNFDIAQVPQNATEATRRTYGDFYAFAIPRAAANKAGSYFVAGELSGTSVSSLLAEKLSMAPVLRSILGQGATQPQTQVLYSAAITARSWLDPDTIASESVFGDMIENVTSGSMTVTQAVTDAVQRLEALFP